MSATEEAGDPLAELAAQNARLAAESNQRLQELQILQAVSQIIAGTLDLELVLKTICAEALRAIERANKVVIHLLDDTSHVLIARATARRVEAAGSASGPPPGGTGPLSLGLGIAGLAVAERRTISVPETRTDRRFVDTGTRLRSLVVAPLLIGERVLGTLTADSLQPHTFDQSAERLLRVLADQAAIAIENARLFEQLRQHIATVSTLKGFQDNIFASIPSGVITTDMQDRITTFNHAAERILGLRAAAVLGRPVAQALAGLQQADLARLLEQVKGSDEPLIGYEAQARRAGGELASLSLSLAPLRDASAEARLGVAIVLEDLTEQKRLQARQELFGRYLAPSVIRRLPDDPDQLRLGGQQQTISILFADIRGYSTFSEGISPQSLVEVLNQYLSLAAQAILAEEGTLDKFMGDAVMAFWNAPEEQRDHALRAVRAAWRVRCAILDYQQAMPDAPRWGFGVGLHTGEAVVGNIGTARALNYTAIGAVVNLAKRLQEGAPVNQVVMSDAIHRQVREWVEAVPLKAVRLKGSSAIEKRWALRGLRM